MNKIEEKPKDFESYLSDYGPVSFDSYCDEPVCWGFRILKRMGELKFSI